MTRFRSNMISTSRFTLLIFIIVHVGSLVNPMSGSTIHEKPPVFSNVAYGQGQEQIQAPDQIEDPCLPGSLPYIRLIMNITHRQWKSSLGDPISNITRISATDQNTPNLDDEKYHQNFTDGAIYWTSNTGAHEVHGNIYDKWKSMGLERSFLGYPITDEKPTPRKDAVLNIFEGGAIYWSPLTGAHEIHGSIYDKWKSMGLERSFLGYPITDERPLPDGNGSISYFQGGAIVWTPVTGANVMHSKDFTEYFHSNNTQRFPKINETAAATRLIGDIAFEPIFEGIDFPTSMAFLDAGDVLILEKNKGTVKRIVNGSMIEQSLLDVNVASRGERGMLGIAVSKADHTDDDLLRASTSYSHKINATMGLSTTTTVEQSVAPPSVFVFLYFTESRTKDTSDVCEELLQNEVIGNRLYRYELAPNGTKLVNPKLLLSLPATFSSIHQGGKMLIGPDDNLYLIVGDISRTSTRAQNDNDGANANGSSVVYRITKDGEPAQGNPFIDDLSLSKFYAYGIRNGFGLDIDSVTGRLWDTENGEDNFDEINLVDPRFNSGWTAIQGFAKDRPNFDFSDLADTLSNNSRIKGVYSDPEFVWNFTVGVTDIEFFNSDNLGPQYKDDLFVADIENENLYRFELNENRTELSLYGPLVDKVADNPSETELPVIAHGFGSITDIETGPEGYLYATAIESYYPEVEGSGTLFRLMPPQNNSE